MSIHRQVAIRWKWLAAALLWLAAACPRATAQTRLEQEFRDPPANAQPWCYWYWISDNISREGITRDLEAMADVGIGEALLGNVFLEGTPVGDVKVLTDTWWDLTEFAIREGNRLGVDIGLFNCPGWSQSGGPWIEPAQAMRYLVSSETRVRGPIRFEQVLPAPRQPFQDVAVLAYPAPQGDGETLAALKPQVQCEPSGGAPQLAVDGNRDTALAFPAGAGQGEQPFSIELTLAQPLTARHLSVYPGDTAWSAECVLQAADANDSFRTIRQFAFDRSNRELHVGPLPRGPVTVSFAPVTSQRFRLQWSHVAGPAAVAEIELSPAARVEAFVEKQLGKMHPTPLPHWDTYLWPHQVEPDQVALTVPRGEIRNLSEQMAADGTLRWDVPPGTWVIERLGMTTTGTRNAPASPEGTGLEVDKMNRLAAAAHFDAFLGHLLRRMPADERQAWKHVVADSYEMGPQNWTDDWAATFTERYGYDPLPWLPTLSGRIVGTADQSNRFLWDLRRLVADRIATEYVGGLRDLCHEHGLQLWLENYGHWGFPAEFLQYGGQSDCLGGEFWVTGGLGSIECRAASSAAAIYGLPRVSAEAFTGGPPFRSMPEDLKARGDWAFCEGINHFVLTVYNHQPWEDRLPGMNAWFGSEINRHNTWFAESGEWITYLRRCCYLLQQGTRVADVAYFIGEDAPKMSGIRQPPLPPGRDFDYINAEVIEQRLSVTDGRLTLPGGASYRVLVLPELVTMRPALLHKIRDLVRAGATVLGPAPECSPSLQDYPTCDEQVRRLAAELWGPSTSRPAAGVRRVGEGRVIWGQSLDEVFQAEECPADFHSPLPLLYTHRHTPDADIYFVSNQRPQAIATTVTFRVGGRVPELWCPLTGRIALAVVYDEAEDVVHLPLHLEPSGSVFVVFRAAETADRVVAVERSGQTILAARAEPSNEPAVETGEAVQDNFTLAVWALPAADTTLLAASNTGVSALGATHNVLLAPPHGSMFGDATHAGCGLAVGRNGVCILEHGASYFAPPLVHAAPLDDWTHVTVVYRKGQPSLYLDGALVDVGMRSTYRVHPGTMAVGGEGAFVGRCGAVEVWPRPLDAAEVAELPRRMPRPDRRLPGSEVQLMRAAEGKIAATVWEAGDYTLRAADGAERLLMVQAVPEPLTMDGPWQVQFDPSWGGPAQAEFAQLVDWRQRPEEGIRHYSGRATYRREFTVPESWPAGPVWLDLGEVRDLAVVRVNGHKARTLWTAPWRTEITSLLQAGSNVLEVDVINAWNNRLAGDQSLPESERRTYLAIDTLDDPTPRLPAGLLGPVTLTTPVCIELP